MDDGDLNLQEEEEVDELQSEEDVSDPLGFAGPLLRTDVAEGCTPNVSLKVG
jgi:hypothetical protein